MKMNTWVDAIRGGCTDGHYYKMIRANDNRLSLLAWPDDGGEIIDDDVVEVSESAFNSFDEICQFAREIGTVLECDPVTVIHSIRG